MLKSLVILLRPQQWLKNLFVLAPAFFAGSFLIADVLRDSLLTFIIFSAAASTVYIFNDWIDRQADSKHPEIFCFLWVDPNQKLKHVQLLFGESVLEWKEGQGISCSQTNRIQENEIKIGVHKGSRSLHSNDDPEFETDGTDLAVVWGQGEWSNNIFEKLMEVEFTPVCSPHLLDAKFPLDTPEDLIHYPLLDVEGYDVWKEWLEKAGIPEKKYRRRTIIRDSNVLIHSALNAHGIALSAVGIVQEYLDSGKLVRPFELSITAGGFFYLVYPEKSLRKPLVHLFKEWLVEEVQRAEDYPSSK